MFNYSDEFIVVRFNTLTKGLYVYWQPKNQSMSMLEFSRAMELLLNTATITQPAIILFDASDFNYPILTEATNRLIRNALVDSSVKYYGVIKSKHRLGEITISRLLKHTDDFHLNITLFNTRIGGLRWFFTKHQ